MTTRAERRQQRARNLKRWERIVRAWGSPSVEPWFTRIVRQLAGHGKLCSCSCCGNRRSVEGPTIQERRQEEAP